MRRRTVHALFAAAALAAATATLWQAVRWQRAEAVQHAIETVARVSAAQASQARAGDADARVQLARARALRRAGDADGALAIYDGLATRQRDPAIGELALYNAGHVLLEQALAAAARGDSARCLPLAELAKQRLRALLRSRPDAWDARYNLERALRLAPEDEEPADDPARRNVEKRQVRMNGMVQQDLP